MRSSLFWTRTKDAVASGRNLPMRMRATCTSDEGVGLEAWQEVHAGWLNVLFPLKAFVVHGVDLRNHDPTRVWDDGYADQ